jgi:monovalent cation:H+ antiporter, CPA1 family
MDKFLSTETLILELLLIVIVVAIAVRRFRVPYTVALVIVGLALTLQQSFHVDLTSELILALFVPPLVFEAALGINFDHLRRDLPRVLLLAVPGVIVTTLVVAGMLTYSASLAFPAALVFGALISATDPVAVVSMFRTLGVPRRLAILVESESLLNDGTAIVVFNLATIIALTGHFDFWTSVLEFVRVSVGGVTIGLLLGWVVARVISQVDDYLIQTTLTTLLAYGSYLVGERLHVSGVLAVVAAGLINGNLGPQGLSPTSRIVINNFWEYIAFLANSLVFLLIGLEVNLPALLAAWQPVIWAIAAVLVARVIVVYGISRIFYRFRFAERVPLSWLHVLNWGGLRGAIALALVLSLPAGIDGDRNLMKLMAFGVVLFTLLVQGTTMRPLLKRLNLIIRLPEQAEYEKQHARLTAARASLTHLERRHAEGLVSTHALEILKHHLAHQITTQSEAVRRTLKSAPQIEAEELDTALRESLRARRSAILGLRHDGVISDETFNQLSLEIDAALDSDESEIYEQVFGSNPFGQRGMKSKYVEE